jgi:predicted phosphodiesterase
MIEAKEKILTRAMDLADIRGGFPERLYMPSLGDLIENCSQNYAQQRFRVEANLRYQVKLAYEIFTEVVTYLAPHFNEIIVPVIGGNHGEFRDGQSGKNETDFSDNFDVSIWEIVDRIVHANTDQYDHVRILTPYRDLTYTFDVFGTIVGIAHGHQFGAGVNAHKKSEEWWKKQMLGQQPIGDADILLTGHFHHLNVVQNGNRVWMQAPALEGGSEWYKSTNGVESPPGLLSFTIDKSGWGRDPYIIQ